MEKFLEMFQIIERVLVQNKFYILPIIHIRPELEKHYSVKLREIIRRRGGQVVESEEGATHVLYPPCDPLEEEYPRPLDTLSLELPRAHPWRVTATWLLESDQYNEWLPEEDYEVDELGRRKIQKLRMSVEDLMNTSGDPDRNRWAKIL